MDRNLPSDRTHTEKKETEQYVFTVDSFNDGIAFGQQQPAVDLDPRQQYALKLEPDSGVVKLRSRYKLHRGNPLHDLERYLMGLSQQGILSASSIYLGTTTDPFYPFEGKFDASMRFLELFERYTPGMLYIQTRSPLLVIALPIFKRLREHCAVTIGIETCDEESVRRYTPGLPRVSERLKTATALRRFGVEVNLQVRPVLPYGDWKNDAGQFADLLVEHADGIYIEALTDGTEAQERRIRSSALAKRLAEDRKFHWLRPDSANPLWLAVEERAPEKLFVKPRPQLDKKQLEMFAA
jgi:hypothetical protein